MAEQEAPAYEHARRERARWPTAGLDWNGWRIGRPLIGGLVGFGVVVLFLAVRGGDTEAGDPLTGTVRGGWSREEDVHLLILVNVAMAATLLVGLLSEWVRHWLYVYLAAMMGGVFLAIREVGDVGDTAAAVLLGLTIAGAAIAAAMMVFDLVRYRQRQGY